MLRLPTSLSEARRCLAEGAVPVGGATLVWAQWQRDGFPEQAMSLRRLPEATVVGAETLGAAVLLHQIDDRVPEVLRRAAASIGTGAVRRAATVGGNIVGSTLRCLLPPALVLDAKATVMDDDGTYEAELAEVVAKRPLMLAIHWRRPVVSGYHKAPGEVGGPPPLVVATAVHAEEDGGRRLFTAVRDGDEVLSGSVSATADTHRVLDALEGTALGGLPGRTRDVVRREVADVVGRAGT